MNTSGRHHGKPTIQTLVMLLLGSAMLCAADDRAPLWPGKAPLGDGSTEDANAFLTIHRPANGQGVTLVICPGGGYGGMMVGPEGHRIAAWLNEHGITGAVLEYRLPKGRPDVPLLDAQRAIRSLRARAGELKLDPRRIGIIGFSAGGHLAAMAAVRGANGDPRAADPVERKSSRPDFAILIYPVVSMVDGITSRFTRKNLLGERPAQALIEAWSAERLVGPDTSPVYFAHAIDDKTVTIENSRLMQRALAQAKVPAELLELPNGGHGLNQYSGPSWEAWKNGSLVWLAKLPPGPRPVKP
jgi:acetyl esterase/lipase